MANSINPYTNSLYVGDLSEDVDEKTLCEFFSSIGPVHSVRVCRDSLTGKSLLYGYVNFYETADAIKAKETVNYKNFLGKVYRIMSIDHDSTSRKSGDGNVYVSNLDKSFNTELLYQTFSVYGKILSCKVVTDDKGVSKGFGFIQFDSNESAEKAIQNYNKKKFGDKKIYVGPFKNRLDRIKEKQNSFTGLFVKQFPENWTKETMHLIFSSIGDIADINLKRTKAGDKIAFIYYKSTEAAKKAINLLHGITPSILTITNVLKTSDKSDAFMSSFHATLETNDKPKNTEGESPSSATESGNKLYTSSPNELNESSKNTDDNDVLKSSQKSNRKKEDVSLYVQRAVGKTERDEMIKESKRIEKESKKNIASSNIYVKYLDSSVTSEDLHNMFSRFGKIISAKIMENESGISKCFGFVSFENPESAAAAIVQMNKTKHKDKVLYVAIAEDRLARYERLAQQFRNSNLSTFGPAHGHMVFKPSNIVHPSVIPYVTPVSHFSYDPNSTRVIPTGHKNTTRSKGNKSYVNNTLYSSSNNNPSGWRNTYNASNSRNHGAHVHSSGKNFGSIVQPMASYSVLPKTITPHPNCSSNEGSPGDAQLTASIVFGKTSSHYIGKKQDLHNHVTAAKDINGLNVKLPESQLTTTNSHQHHLVTSSDLSALVKSLEGQTPERQKRLIGERLFLLVQKHQPELACKITGMMLELPKDQLITLLDSEEELKAKTNEALQVLHDHQQDKNQYSEVPSASIKEKKNDSPASLNQAVIKENSNSPLPVIL